VIKNSSVVLTVDASSYKITLALKDSDFFPKTIFYFGEETLCYLESLFVPFMQIG